MTAPTGGARSKLVSAGSVFVVKEIGGSMAAADCRIMQGSVRRQEGSLTL